MTADDGADRATLYERLPLLASDRWWVERARAAGDRSVLELGAGAGRLTAAFVAAGLEVVAVERDPAMEAALRRRVPTATVVAADACALGPPPLAGVRDRAVGTVALPASLVNEQPDAAARRSLLAVAAAWCRPDGVVLLHLLSPWWLAAMPARSAGRLHPADGGDAVDVAVEAGSFTSWPGRRRATLTYRFADGAVLHDALDASVVTPDELLAACAAVGLEIVEVAGGDPPRPPTPTDSSWHLVTRPVTTRPVTTDRGA